MNMAPMVIEMVIAIAAMELSRMPAKHLVGNLACWRPHPKARANALRALLDETGNSDALLARGLPDGHLLLAEMMPDREMLVPVFASFAPRPPELRR